MFRKRIGEAGMELILAESIRINRPPDDPEKPFIVSVDTTVQEKNIIYPTDGKQYKKIIKKCWKIAAEEQINLRQSYQQIVKKYLICKDLKAQNMGPRKHEKLIKK